MSTSIYSQDYFFEEPRAIDPKMFPTWPAKSEQAAGAAAVKKVASPKPPSGENSFSYQSN